MIKYLFFNILDEQKTYYDFLFIVYFNGMYLEAQCSKTKMFNIWSIYYQRESFRPFDKFDFFNLKKIICRIGLRQIQ